MKKEFVDRVNGLIDDYVIDNSCDWKLPNNGWGVKLYYDHSELSYFTAEGGKKFQTLVDEIIENDSQIRGYVASQTVAKWLRGYIHKCKQEGKKTCFDELSGLIKSNFADLPLVNMEILHRLYGVTITREDPIEIGLFTFYQAERHQSEIIARYYPKASVESVKPFVDQLRSHPTWVSVKVKAKDDIKANQLANDLFGQLQNLFRYLLAYVFEKWDIAVFNYREQNADQRIILSKENAWIKYDYSDGALGVVDLDEFFRKFQKGKLDPCSIIKRIGSPLSKMEARFMTAIDLYGRAMYDRDKPIGFLEAMMAVESLLQMNTNQLVNQSITAQISEYCAFLLGRDYEKRIEIEEIVKKLYSTRSKLAHGNVSNVSAEENSLVFDFAKAIISKFAIDEYLRNMKKPEELIEYVKKLKFGALI